MRSKLLRIALLLGLTLYSASGLNGQTYRSAERQQGLADFEVGQMEQAKRGGREQLQQLACELGYGTAIVKHNAIWKIVHVGGWFSIRMLSQLLQDEPRYTGSSGDGYITPLRFQALQALPEAVSNPPLPPVQVACLVDCSKEIEIWRNWLKANQESLRKSEPIGDGIIENEKVCRKVLKNDLASTAYPKPKHEPHGRPQ